MLEIAVLNAPLQLKYAQIVSEKLSIQQIKSLIVRLQNQQAVLAYLAHNKQAIGICEANTFPTENTDLHCFALFKREDARALLLALTEEIHLENFVRAMKIATESKTIKGYLSHYFHTLEVVLLENLADSALNCLQKADYDACILPHFVAESFQLLPYKVQRMNVMSFIPEAGAGIMGIFGNIEQKYKKILEELFHHLSTEILFQTEMAFEREIRLNALFPSFAFATSIGQSLSLTAGIVAENGAFLHKKTIEGQIFETENLGKSLAYRILENL